MKVSDGQEIACATTGSGPAVVCVPGGPARAAEYLGDLGGLSTSHSLVLVDNRGSGGSRPADIATITVERMAHDLLEVVDQIGQKPVLLGHSFGTRVVAKALAVRPDLASAVVLVTPALADGDTFTEGRATILSDRDGDPSYADAVDAARSIPSARPRDMSMLFEQTVPLWYGSWGPAQQQHAAASKQQVDVRAAMSVRNDLAHWSLPDLSAVEVPVLVVAGSLDFLTPPAAAHAAMELFRDGTYAEIEGAGHFPWLDDADAFTAVVRDFLAGDGLT